MNMQDSFDYKDSQEILEDKKIGIQSAGISGFTQEALSIVSEVVSKSIHGQLKQLTVDSKDESVKVLVSASFIEKFLIGLVELFSQDNEDWGDYLVNTAEWGSDLIDANHPAYIVFESMHKLSEAVNLDLDDLPETSNTENEVCAIGIEYEFLVRVGDRVRTYSWAYTSPDNKTLGVSTGTIKDFLWGNYPVSLIVELDESKELVEIQSNLLEPLRDKEG